MYAAFGTKDDLFHRALERYTQGPAAYGARALREPTAEQVAAAFLRGSVDASTGPGCPAGCLGVQGALAAGATARAAHDALVAWREEGVSRLRQRFQQASDEGDLPSGTDPDLLARYVMTVSNGIAVQASGGTARRRTAADRRRFHTELAARLNTAQCPEKANQPDGTSSNAGK